MTVAEDPNNNLAFSEGDNPLRINLANSTLTGQSSDLLGQRNPHLSQRFSKHAQGLGNNYVQNSMDFE